MTSHLRLKHVESWRDRHGHRRWYFRRGKGKRIPPPAPDAPGFAAAYAAALATPEPERGPRTRGAPGTFEHVASLYHQSTQFLRLKESTRRAATLYAANNDLKRLRALIKFAVDLGLRADDPTQGAARYREGPGHHSWTEEQRPRSRSRSSRRPTSWAHASASPSLCCSIPGNVAPTSSR